MYRGAHAFSVDIHSKNITAVVSTPKDITLAVEQTLACNIGDLDASKPVTVTWTESDGKAVANGDDYSIAQGTVDGSGNQISVLTIKTAKLKTFTSPSSVTYKCSVKSSLYATSPTSANVDVVGNVLKFGK